MSHPQRKRKHDQDDGSHRAEVQANTARWLLMKLVWALQCVVHGFPGFEDLLQKNIWKVSRCAHYLRRVG